MIVAGVLGLVVVLGIGVAAGVWLRGRDGGAESVRGTATAAPPPYSMAAITDACQLIDPAPLTRWSPKLQKPPEHEETRPDADGGGSTSCDVSYAGDDIGSDTTALRLETDFTRGTAPPFYDHWKHLDTVTRAGPDTAWGAITDLGEQGYWSSETSDSIGVRRAYIVCVQDGNVSVRAKIDLDRNGRRGPYRTGTSSTLSPDPRSASRSPS